jgi:hypothetical protein
MSHKALILRVIVFFRSLTPHSWHSAVCEVYSMQLHLQAIIKGLRLRFRMWHVAVRSCCLTIWAMNDKKWFFLRHSLNNCRMLYAVTKVNFSHIVSRFRTLLVTNKVNLFISMSEHCHLWFYSWTYLRFITCVCYFYVITYYSLFL